MKEGKEPWQWNTAFLTGISARKEAATLEPVIKIWTGLRVGRDCCTAADVEVRRLHAGKYPPLRKCTSHPWLCLPSTMHYSLPFKLLFEQVLHNLLLLPQDSPSVSSFLVNCKPSSKPQFEFKSSNEAFRSHLSPKSWPSSVFPSPPKLTLYLQWGCSDLNYNHIQNKLHICSTPDLFHNTCQG